MLAVALSGIIGRYLYSQIPRSLSAAELSLGELDSEEEELSGALASQSIYTQEELKQAMAVPTYEHIRTLNPFMALVEMVALNIRQPFQMAALRRRSASFGGVILSLGGFRSIGNAEVDNVVRLVRQKVSLSRRVLFLDHTQRVFHLWHVIHRPFSYAFVVRALAHIAVVIGLGFL